MLNVEWISSGKAWPDHSFKRIPPSDGPDGPSQTLRMSWPTSVSKTMKWRLKTDSLEIHHHDLKINLKKSIKSIWKTGSHSSKFTVTNANSLCCTVFELPDGFACISFYYPGAVEIVVVWSWISWRQNPTRHCSSDVASTLSYRDTRWRQARCKTGFGQSTKEKLGILHNYWIEDKKREAFW